MGDQVKDARPLFETPREHIESILKDYQNPGAARATRNLRNAIQIIGERLNRQDIHFVAELVQNAEDAGVRSEQGRVRLKFTVEENRIIAQNDGKEFDRDDVESICDTAASSKRHAENQIGFMGIGFKSVFKVTDAPEIHSAGYHFAIRDYVFPHWLDDSELPDLDMQSAFVLPVKPSVDIQQLAEQFTQLDPTLLLFLETLKSIEIDNQVKGQVHIVEAHSTADGLVVLESPSGVSHWQIARFDVPKSICALYPTDRQGRGKVELQIACAVDEQGRFKRLDRSLFFAFLPTEQETGLGFHLQADFVPTADRESIDEDSRWNQASLQYAGRYLVEQVCHWRDSGKHDLDLYALLPLESEAKDTAYLVAAEAKKYAAREELVLTRSDKWVYPGYARRLEKSSYRPLLELLSKDDLTFHYGRPVDFIHEEIRGRALDFVRSIGVQTFGLEDLCAMLDDEEWLVQRPLDWLTDLLISLYDVREDVERMRLLERLKASPIVPLEEGKYAAAQNAEPNQQAFLPLTDQLKDSYTLFRGRLNLVAGTLLDIARAKENGKKALKCLEWLGFQPFEPYPVIRDVILPIFEDDEWQDLDDELHFAYLDFVRRHWQAYREGAREVEDEEDAVQRVANGLWFQGHSDPSVYHRARQLLLPQAYKPDDDLEASLAGVPGLEFISEQYAVREEKARKKKSFVGPSWGDFLRDLGVICRFDLVRIIDDFILPQFQNDSWKHGRMFALTDFIRRHIVDYERGRQAIENQKYYQWQRKDPLIDLKQNLWVASTDVREGVRYCNRPNHLYLSRTYRSDSDVAIAFGDLLAGDYVSGTYLERSAEGQSDEERKALRKSWCELFETIGVLEYVPMISRQNIHETEYPGCGSCWRPHHRRYGKVSDLWNDSVAELLEVLAALIQNSQRKAVQRARAFLRMLDRYWQAKYEPFTTATYSWFYYTDKSKSIPSAFAQILKRNEWVPTQAGTLIRPGEPLFARNLADIVNDPAKICAEEIRNQNLLQFLGIRTGLTVNDVLNLLERARQQKAPNIEHLRALYRWLQEHLSEESQEETLEHWQDQRRVQQKFSEKAYVYLPDSTIAWSKREQCSWEPVSQELIARYRPSLARTYDGLRHFFVDQLGVRELCGVNDYLEVLAQDVAPGPLSEAQSVEVFQVYIEVEKALQAEDETVLEAIEDYKDAPLWLCGDGILRPATEVYLNDQPTLYNLFRTQIDCLWFPQNVPISALENLVQYFGLARLSEVKTEIVRDQIYVVDGIPGNWSLRLPRLVEATIRYLYTFHHSRFLQLWEEGIIERVSRLTPVDTRDSIPVLYQLPHGEKAYDSQEVYVAMEEQRLYVVPSLPPDDPALSQEICRAIRADREIQNFMDSLLPRLDGDGLERFIQQKGLRPLPDNVGEQIQLWRPTPTEEGNEAELTDVLEEDQPQHSIEGKDRNAHIVVTEEDEETKRPSRNEQEISREDGVEAPATEVSTSEPDLTEPEEDEEVIPPFTGETYPRVPYIPTDWQRLRQEYGDAVDRDLDALERTTTDEWSESRPETSTRHVTVVRFILSFMNRTQGFFPLTRDAHDMLSRQGLPGRLCCRLDDETEFELRVDYDKRIVYNQKELVRFFDFHNIPAGGIVYLQNTHGTNVRLFYKRGSGPIRQIRCAELQSDGHVEYFYIDSADYPCEVAEFVFRAEKRLEDPAALFAEAIGKKSVFETMVDIFEEFGPELSIEDVLNIVSTIRMVAFSTIRSELQRRPCFINIGNGMWRFEPGQGFRPLPHSGEPPSNGDRREPSEVSETVGDTEEPTSEFLRKELLERLDGLRELPSKHQDTSLLIRALEKHLQSLLKWLGEHRRQDSS